MTKPDSLLPWRAPLLCLACLALCGLASESRAQDRFAVEQFDPAPDQDGGILGVHGARTLDPGAFGVTLMGSYARKPLTLKSSESGSTLGDLVGSMSTIQLLGSVGIARRFDLGLALPLHRASRGSDFAVDPGPGVRASLLTSSDVGLGDIRVVPRVALLTREAERGVGLALLVPVYLPTGKDEMYGGESLRAEPRLALDLQRGRFRVAFNAGYMLRAKATLLNSTVDDQLRLGAGTEIPFGAGLSGLVEIDSQLGIRDDDFGDEDAPTEGLLGIRLRKAGLLAELGGGPGIVRGIGAPSYRLFLAVGYSRARPPERDSDADGVWDGRDRCPMDPEDRDGFEDQDGCPEDNDGDGIFDGQDGCPTDPEDADGFEDQDGCPDTDDDHDGIADAADRCPKEPEEPDGFEDKDGCPDPDNDQDGVLDAEDACVDKAGPKETRGCPIEAPKETPLVKVTEEQIEIEETIFFAIDRADVEARSDPLLDAIADALKAHPEIERLRVEAHTDDTGPKFHNQQLSDKRAQAVVDALVKRGIAKPRLTAKGYGSTKPIVANDSDENRARNRRAELHIEKRSSATSASTPEASAPTK